MMLYPEYIVGPIAEMMLHLQRDVIFRLISSHLVSSREPKIIRLRWRIKTPGHSSYHVEVSLLVTMGLRYRGRGDGAEGQYD